MSIDKELLRKILLAEDRAGVPLNDTQITVLTDRLSLWCEDIYIEGRAHQVKLEIQGRDRFLSELRSKQKIATNNPNR